MPLYWSWTTADWADAVALSDKALASLDDGYGRGDPFAVRAWGSLQLRAAVSAARAGNTAEMTARISFARTAAGRVDAEDGPPVYDRHSLTFSSGNVAIHAVSVVLEVGDQAQALALNARTHPGVVAVLPAVFTDRRSAAACPDLRLLVDYMFATESGGKLPPFSACRTETACQCGRA
jgi:hypothetical protein